jgi:hypothetical protein
MDQELVSERRLMWIEFGADRVRIGVSLRLPRSSARQADYRTPRSDHANRRVRASRQGRTLQQFPQASDSANSFGNDFAQDEDRNRYQECNIDRDRQQPTDPRI